MTALVVAPMVLTGYLIQAVTHRGWLLAMVIGHGATGLGYLGVLAVHQLAIRGRRRPAGVELAGSPEPAGDDHMQPGSVSRREVARSRA